MIKNRIFQIPVNEDLSFLVKIEVNPYLQTGSFSKNLIKNISIPKLSKNFSRKSSKENTFLINYYYLIFKHQFFNVFI
mgnify:CR=1 FL=1